MQSTVPVLSSGARICRAAAIAHFKMRNRQLSEQAAVKQIMAEITTAEGKPCEFMRAARILDERMQRREVRSDHACTEGHIIHAAKRSAGDECSLLEAIALRKTCWVIHRVLVMEGCCNASLKNAALIHSKVERIRKMHQCSTYSEATKEYLRLVDEGRLH